MRGFLIALVLFAGVSCGFLGGRRVRNRRVLGACKDRGLPEGSPLLLSPLLAAGNFSAARQRSRIVVDGIDLGHSGYFSVKTASGVNTNNFFTWYQPAGQVANLSEAPLLLWLQGGPGAPSSYGSTDEIGQFYIDGNCEVQKRLHSWCSFASCIFIDQPAVTGFTFQTNSSGQTPPPDQIEYTKSSADAGKQLSLLMKQFMQLFPEHQSSPFWITGESYAGHYIANTATQMMQVAPEIKLVGVSAGDPVLNAVAQFPTYPDTFYGMGLINLVQRQTLRTLFQQSVEKILTEGCRAGFNLWDSVFNDDGAGSAFLFETYTGSGMTDHMALSTPPASMSYSTNWLALSQVAHAMHYSGAPLGQLNEGGKVYSTLVDSGDFCQNSSSLYGDLLNAGLHVHIYSSNMDPILGPPTSEAGIMAMMASAGLTESFVAAPRELWSDVVGLNGYSQCFKTTRGARFCYTTVRNAGHEQPAFQPRAGADMTYRFFNDIAFAAEKNPAMPQGPQCSGTPPFAGSADCQCPSTA